MCEIAPRRDKHSARGGRQPTITDDLQQGKGKASPSRIPSEDNMGGFYGSMRGAWRWPNEKEIYTKQ